MAMSLTLLMAAGCSSVVLLQIIWNYIAEDGDPHQAGLAFLLSVWGQAWSAGASCSPGAVPVLPACLALAWVYRTGRDLLNAPWGRPLCCAVAQCLRLLSRLHDPRAIHLHWFPSLQHALHLVLLAPCAESAANQHGCAQAGLLLGSVGLLYSHYFCALFLPALGLFHLLFVPKNRRWWQPVLLLRPRCPAGHAAAARFSAGDWKIQQAKPLHMPPFTARLPVTCISTPPQLHDQWP